MSAASIIERVRAAGGEITLAADGIRLKVPASLRDGVVAEVKAHKDAIKIALKCETDDPWDAADYRAFYEERAGVAEFDGGLTREEAEAAAFEVCVVEWLELATPNLQPPANAPLVIVWQATGLWSCRSARESFTLGYTQDVGPCGTAHAEIELSKI